MLCDFGKIPNQLLGSLLSPPLRTVVRFTARYRVIYLPLPFSISLTRLAGRIGSRLYRIVQLIQSITGQ